MKKNVLMLAIILFAGVIGVTTRCHVGDSDDFDGIDLDVTKNLKISISGTVLSHSDQKPIAGILVAHKLSNSVKSPPLTYTYLDQTDSTGRFSANVTLYFWGGDRLIISDAMGSTYEPWPGRLSGYVNGVFYEDLTGDGIPLIYSPPPGNSTFKIELIK